MKYIQKHYLNIGLENQMNKSMEFAQPVESHVKV